MIRNLLLSIALISAPVAFTEIPSEIPSEEEPATSEVTSSDVIDVEDEKEPFDISKWLTPTLIAAITQVVTVLTVVIKLANDLKNLRKENHFSAQEMYNGVKAVIEPEVKKGVEKATVELLEPLYTKVDEITPILEVLVKMMVLLQEDTPESRLAALDLIGELGRVSAQQIEKSKKVIIDEVEAEQAKEQRIKSTIAEVAEKQVALMPID